MDWSLTILIHKDGNLCKFSSCCTKLFESPTAPLKCPPEISFAHHLLLSAPFRISGYYPVDPCPCRHSVSHSVGDLMPPCCQEGSHKLVFSHGSNSYPVFIFLHQVQIHVGEHLDKYIHKSCGMSENFKRKQATC